MEDYGPAVFSSKNEKTSSGKKIKSVVSYQIFVLENKSKLQGKYPFLKAHQINGKLKSLWNTLPEEEKGKYRKFTLISTPTPPNKSPKVKNERKGNSCRGRLLTPKALRTNKTACNSGNTESPLFKSKGKIDDSGHWENTLLGPYHDSDEDSVEADEKLEPDPCLFEEDDPGNSRKDSPVPWPKESNTYNTRYSVEKNYKAPEIISNSGMSDRSGILKSANKENRRPRARVSFSTKDVEVKIMSEMEDSCSTTNASQDPGSSFDTNPYNFDAIDKFEICIGSPKPEQINTLGKQSSISQQNCNTKKESKITSSKNPPKKAARRKTISPAVQTKRMLRSRSPNQSAEKERKFVFKLDELSSSPCQDAESGRGDAEESFLSEDGIVSDCSDAKWSGRKPVSQCLLAGGDNQKVLQTHVSMTTETPPSLDTSTDTNNAILAPRKRRQLAHSLKETKKAPSNEKSKISAARLQKWQSPRFQTKADTAYVSMNNDAKKSERKAKHKPSRRRPETTMGNKSDCYGSLLESSDNSKQMLSTDVDVFQPKLNYTEFTDEPSSGSEAEMSPVLLESQAKSRMSVAETIRSLKMIASPDNIALSEESTSDSPKILSPTLSDISVLSSLSSNEGCVSEQNESAVQRKGALRQDRSNQQKMRGNAVNALGMNITSKLLPRLQSKWARTKVREPLCDMFQDMTPPELRMMSTRRLVSSSKKEGTGNFEKLFEENEIFG
ncbi:uncharacterized protein LOC135472299 [Liolophura sinensis]|uniref:uncharacterized protein LOC135472299 n=1 Tax=Liolophura sinensis TaxID=3198878 RepID=UPI0031586973